MEAGPLNERLKRKLADLGRALSEALSGSSDASRQLSELREEGYSVYLLLESDGVRAARTGDGAPAARADAARALSAQRQLDGRRHLDGQRQLTGLAGQRQLTGLAGQRQLTGERQLDRPEPPAADRRLGAAPLPEPSFLIDGRDLAFLRSVGIDPTRSPRRRR
jgi:hypothetical protein